MLEKDLTVGNLRYMKQHVLVKEFCICVKCCRNSMALFVELLLTGIESSRTGQMAHLLKGFPPELEKQSCDCPESKYKAK